MQTYNPYFLPEFKKQVLKYRHLSKSIKNKVRLLCQDPYHNCKSEPLVGNLKGFRSARVTKSMRIIFSICDECRKRHFQDLIGCSPDLYNTLPNMTILFITLGSNDKVYK